MSEIVSTTTRNTMMDDVARLARRAERWGAPPQGVNVALFAENMRDGDIVTAMEHRDKIASDLSDARTWIIIACTVFGLPIVGGTCLFLYVVFS